MKMIQVIRMAMGALAMAVTSMAVAQTTLRIGTQLPETHPSYLGTLEVKKKLEELSKGSMTLRIFPNSQLGEGRRERSLRQEDGRQISGKGHPRA